MKNSKAVCRACHRVVGVNRNGKAARHGYNRFRATLQHPLSGTIGHDGDPCPGSGKSTVREV